MRYESGERPSTADGGEPGTIRRSYRVNDKLEARRCT
jgi:hypothetical protein